MTLPAKLINILAEHTATENMQCADCKGAGNTGVQDPETGTEFIMCECCLGSGYNQLGMIIKGILKPPEDGYGPVELQAALKAYAENEAALHTETPPQQTVYSRETTTTDAPNAAEQDNSEEWAVAEKTGFFTLTKTHLKNRLQKNPNGRKKTSGPSRNYRAGN